MELAQNEILVEVNGKQVIAKLKPNQILIELPEWSDKNIMYSTISIANGWKEYNQRQTIEWVEVTGREQAEAKAQEFIAQDIFQWADTVQGKEDTYFVKYLSTIDEKNPITAEKQWQDLALWKIFELYASSQLAIDTKEEREALEKKQKEIIENVNSMKVEVK